MTGSKERKYWFVEVYFLLYCQIKYFIVQLVRSVYVQIERAILTEQSVWIKV